MKVSVITVTYNSQKYIHRAIDSVNTQDYPNIEHIFIDGMSVDETINIIKCKSQRSVKVVSEPDNGIYDAMNKGLAIASGDIICFLNSDDFYSGTRVISNVVSNFQTHKCLLITSNIQFIDNNNDFIRFYKSYGFRKSHFKFGLMPAHPGTFLSSSLVKLLPNFSVDLKIAADFEYLLKVYKKINQKDIFEMDESTVHMQVGGISTRDISVKYTITREIFKVLKRNGEFASYILIFFRFPFKYFQNL